MQLVMDADRLDLSLEGVEHLLAFKLEAISVPLSHVVRADNALPPSTWKELRAPGTFVPGLIKAGTYYTGRGKEFWYVTRSMRDKPLTIELQNERFRRLVVCIEDHVRWAERINAHAGG